MGQAQKQHTLLPLTYDWAEHACGAESSCRTDWEGTTQHCAQEEKEMGLINSSRLLPHRLILELTGGAINK